MVTNEAQISILAEFDEQAKSYQQFANKLEYIIKDLLYSKDIIVHVVVSRLKDRQKLLGKLIKKKDANYNKLADITDIAGVRIITNLASDVDKVAKIIRQEFLIDEINSIDKRQSNRYDAFGYASLHYVVSLNESRANATENNKIKNLKAELQIRSILQHAWAEIEHDSGYKNQIEVEPFIKRRFARLASLLELADEEFNTINVLLVQKANEAIERIKQDKPVEINSLTIKAFLSSENYVTGIEGALFNGYTKMPLEPYDYEQIVLWMHDLGLQTFRKAGLAVQNNFKLLQAFKKYWLLDEIGPYRPLGISIYFLWLLKYESKRNINPILYAMHNIHSMPQMAMGGNLFGHTASQLGSSLLNAVHMAEQEALN